MEKLLLTGVFLSAIFNVNHSAVVKAITAALAVPTIIFSWLDLAHPTSLYFIGNASLTAIFMLITTCSILYDVILRARVTLETLRGVVCAYFMVAFAFAHIYYLIEYINPGIFPSFEGHLYLLIYLFPIRNALF